MIFREELGMMKVETWYYGSREILDSKKVREDIDLYIGEIVVCEHRIKGVINSDGTEIVPFRWQGTGEFITRIIDDDTVIFDYMTTDNGWVKRERCGSFLCVRKDDGKFTRIYISSAAVILATNDMLYGANFDIRPKTSFVHDLRCSTKTFEYNYKTKEIVASKEFGKFAYLNGELQEYLCSKLFPYSESVHNLDKVRRRALTREFYLNNI